MARVKRAVNAHKKRRVTLERASGYRGQRSRLYRKAKEQVTHSLVYSYRDRKAQKGDFRKLWIQRINAAARARRHDLQPVHPGPARPRRRGGPQDPGRPGRQRPAGVRRAGRDRQGGAARGRQRAAPRPRPDQTARSPATARPVARVAADAPSRSRRAERPGQDGAQARPSRFPRRAPAVPRRGPAGRPRGAGACRAACARCSPLPGRAPRPARHRAATASPWLLVDEPALAVARPRPSTRRAWWRSAGFLDVPLADVLRRPAAPVAVCADVRDPGNAGTVIRCADAAGAGRRRADRRRRSTPTTARRCGPRPARCSTCRSSSSPTSTAAVAALQAAGLRRARRRRRRRGRPRRRRRRRGCWPADRLAVRQRGLGAARRAARRWPTTGCGSRSTAGPRASTWPPPPPSASTPAPAPSAAGDPTEPAPLDAARSVHARTAADGDDRVTAVTARGCDVLDVAARRRGRRRCRRHRHRTSTPRPRRLLGVPDGVGKHAGRGGRARRTSTATTGTPAPRPYDGLATRTAARRGRGTSPTGTSCWSPRRLARDGPRGPVDRRRGLPALGAGPRAPRPGALRPGRHRRPRAALAADRRQGLHRDAAVQVGPVQRRPEAADAARRSTPTPTG